MPLSSKYIHRTLCPSDSRRQRSLGWGGGTSLTPNVSNRPSESSEIAIRFIILKSADIVAPLLVLAIHSETSASSRAPMIRSDNPRVALRLWDSRKQGSNLASAQRPSCPDWECR